MARLAAIAVVVLLALAGCGSDDARKQAPSGPTRSSERSQTGTVQQEEPAARAKLTGKDLTGKDRVDYDGAKQVCGSLSPSEVAADLDLKGSRGRTSEELIEIAMAYSKGYPGSTRQAAFKGCLAGFSEVKG